MDKIATLKIELNPAGVGTVSLDGVEISHCLLGISFNARAGEPTQVQLSILADVDATVQSHVESVALAKQSIAAEEKIATADGRMMRVRRRVPA